MLKLSNVSKFYYNKGIITSGFSKINLEFNIGEFVAITGASGSGKSTLLNVLSGMDSYEEGEMYINGEETSHYTENDLEDYRRKYVSNIFQNFNLVNSYTAYQNIELVLLLNGYKRKEIKSKVLDLLRQVDMYKFKNTKVSKLSGGQKQRIAIARALAKETPIIIADEPTASLDTKSSKSIIKLLGEISKDKLVIIVTHNYEQVEKYVTRKISMQDGKILEDIKLNDVESIKSESVDTKNMGQLSKLNKINLGIRNAFNIKIKFILTLIVFLFMSFSISNEYASIKNQNDLELIDSQNYYFNSNVNRIVVKKSDNSPFESDDYQSILSINNLNKIDYNDLLSDVQFSFNDNGYFNGNVADISTIKEEYINLGRMPVNDNEIVIYGNKDYNYQLSGNPEELLNKKIILTNNHNGYEETGKYTAFTIVGIVFADSSKPQISIDRYGTISDNLVFYISKNALNSFNMRAIANFTNITEVINNYEYNYNVFMSEMVPKGEAYIDNGLTSICKRENCSNEPINIDFKNTYFKESLNLKITKVYNSSTIKKLLNIENYDSVFTSIYINDEDYLSIFSDKNYQISVYVDDILNLDSVSSDLNKLGFKTLVIKDTLAKTGLVEIIQLFRNFILAILLITLFFISYFIIKIILKSRNVYYATLRILGATEKQEKQLLTIELFVVSTLAYLLFFGTVLLANNNIISINLSDIARYLDFKEYLIIYIIITLMSYLISNRYSRKLFKHSTMATIREEV